MPQKTVAKPFLLNRSAELVDQPLSKLSRLHRYFQVYDLEEGVFLCWHIVFKDLEALETRLLAQHLFQLIILHNLSLHISPNGTHRHDLQLM